VERVGSLAKSRIIQFWSSHIKLSIFSFILSLILIYALNPYLINLPREAIPFVATVFSTLLGLTFTAFAITSAFMPNVRKDYLSTQTFMNVGRTYMVTMGLELTSLVFSFLAYLLFDTSFFVFLIFFTLGGVVFSIAFLAMLLRAMFGLFKSVRNSLIE